MTPGISGVTACSNLGWKKRFNKFMKKKKKAKIVNPKDKNIPIVQKIRQNFGAFLEIFEINLLSFFVLNITIKGKKTNRASFLFLNKITNNATINQKIKLITNHGLVIKEINISIKPI